jgi:hypothetical protein
MIILLRFIADANKIVGKLLKVHPMSVDLDFRINDTQLSADLFSSNYIRPNNNPPSTNGRDCYYRAGIPDLSPKTLEIFNEYAPFPKSLSHRLNSRKFSDGRALDCPLWTALPSDFTDFKSAFKNVEKEKAANTPINKLFCLLKSAFVAAIVAAGVFAVVAGWGTPLAIILGPIAWVVYAVATGLLLHNHISLQKSPRLKVALLLFGGAPFLATYQTWNETRLSELQEKMKSARKGKDAYQKLLTQFFEYYKENREILDKIQPDPSIKNPRQSDLYHAQENLKKLGEFYDNLQQFAVEVPTPN